MFDKEKLSELGYLDEQNFVLGDDDHDIMLRAKYQKNWICGYVPIEVYSLLSDGSTRKSMKKNNSDYLIKRKQRSDGGFMRRDDNLKNYTPPEKLMSREFDFTPSKY